MSEDYTYLVEGCRKRNRKAQKELYETFAPMAMGVCLRYTRCREDACDVMQDGFVRVFERIGQVRDASSLGAWIGRVMVNMCLKHYRRHWRERHLPVDGVDVVVQPDVDRHFEAEAIVAALQQLAPSQRAVFNLVEVDGYSIEEAASMLKCTESNVRALLSRAKVRLREELERECRPKNAVQK